MDKKEYLRLRAIKCTDLGCYQCANIVLNKNYDEIVDEIICSKMVKIYTNRQVLINKQDFKILRWLNEINDLRITE